MLRSAGKLRFYALLLGLIFLAAQFHFCADLTSTAAASHFCPYCATTGAAIAASAPSISLAPAQAPVEFSPSQVFASADAWFNVAPRAPPSL